MGSPLVGKAPGRAGLPSKQGGAIYPQVKEEMPVNEREKKYRQKMDQKANNRVNASVHTGQIKRLM